MSIARLSEGVGGKGLGMRLPAILLLKDLGKLTPVATDALSMVFQSTATPISTPLLSLSKAGHMTAPLTRNPIMAPNQCKLKRK